MIILGFDPGIATFGFGVIESQPDRPKNLTYVNCGVITTKPKEEPEKRLAELAQDLESIITKYKPHVIGIEKLYFQTNVSSAMRVAEARGVAMYFAAKNHIPIIECTPLVIKNAVTGFGKAEKAQVQEMVRTILQLSFIPTPDDAADALATAITAAHLFSHNNETHALA